MTRFRNLLPQPGSNIDKEPTLKHHCPLTRNQTVALSTLVATLIMVAAFASQDKINSGAFYATTSCLGILPVLFASKSEKRCCRLFGKPPQAS